MQDHLAFSVAILNAKKTRRQVYETHPTVLSFLDLC